MGVGTMTIDAEGFIGAVMAVEGIDDATVLLHGQAGCRKGLLFSEKVNPRLDRLDSTDNPMYSGYTVVPYSGINVKDYAGNSAGKFEKALSYLSNQDYSLIAVVRSPGVSIIGDDCIDVVDKLGMAERTVFFDNTETGRMYWNGFDFAIKTILEKYSSGARSERKGTVVVTGLSIMHKNWHTVKDEFTELLELIGLDVICFAGAGCTLRQLIDSAHAEYCLDLSPDHSKETDAWYGSRGVKLISIGKSPVGFGAVSELWGEVSRVTGRDTAVVREKIAGYRRHAYSCIVGSHRTFHGRTFSIRSHPSVDSALSEFLESSFSMVRDEEDPEYLFADGNRCSTESPQSGLKCIDIGFPSQKIQFGKTPVLGLDGVMYLLDCLFNS